MIDPGDPSPHRGERFFVPYNTPYNMAPTGGAPTNKQYIIH